jgi:hypothetical protein
MVNGKDDVYEGYLVDIGDDRVFDFVERGKENKHYAMRIRVKEQGSVQIEFPTFDFLEQRPELIAHETKYRKDGIAVFGVPIIFSNKQIPDEVHLTATSEELRKFFRDHSKDIWTDRANDVITYQKTK